MRKGYKCLKNREHIQQFLATIANELYLEKISVDKAKAVGYICNIMIGNIDNIALEHQIESLISENEKLRGGVR